MSRITEVTIERAYEISEQLQNKTVYEGKACTVYSGDHPVLGAVHITIPPFEAALVSAADLTRLMPVVIQNLTL